MGEMLKARVVSPKVFKEKHDWLLLEDIPEAH